MPRMVGWMIQIVLLLVYIRYDVDYHIIGFKKGKEWVLRKGRIGFKKEMVGNSWIDELPK